MSALPPTMVLAGRIPWRAIVAPWTWATPRHWSTLTRKTRVRVMSPMDAPTLWTALAMMSKTLVVWSAADVPPRTPTPDGCARVVVPATTKWSPIRTARQYPYNRH